MKNVVAYAWYCKVKHFWQRLYIEVFLGRYYTAILKALFAQKYPETGIAKAVFIGDIWRYKINILVIGK
jgi:hypothetical protein